MKKAVWIIEIGYIHCVVDSVGNPAFEACIEGWGHARPLAFSCMGKQEKDCDR